MRGILFLWAIPTLCMWAAEARRVDGERIELAAGETTTSFVVGAHGVEFLAASPATLSGGIALEAVHASGLTASVVAKSLRQVTQDDWRSTQIIAGKRSDKTIDFPSEAFGTAAERRTWKIGGNNNDWDDFSVQWDGWLLVSSPDVDLATSSDDGSRVWLDLNGNDRIDAGEWGSNGWGNGQGATAVTVHHHVPPGLYRLRVQYEEGGGGNSMRLLWNNAAHGADASDEWSAVPAEAFAPAAVVSLSGELVLTGPLTGQGTLVLGNGIHLGSTPHGPQLSIAGHVTVTADLDLRQTKVTFTPGSSLDLAGHTVQLGLPNGAGSIELAHGNLTLAPGTTALAVNGSGVLSTAGTLVLAQLAPTVDLGHGTVRIGNRFVTCQALAAPLTTIIPLSEASTGPQEIIARINVPADAPPGMGLGAWRADRCGVWFQSIHPQPLTVGMQTVHLRLDREALLMAEGHGGVWDQTATIDAQRVGLFLYADVPSTATIAIDSTIQTLPTLPVENGLTVVDLGHFDGMRSHAITGKRWSLSVLPLPYPSAPCDPLEYALDLTVVQPDGKVVKLAGFHNQPVTAADRGDHETFTPAGPPCFQVRFRPSQPGRHRLSLTAVRQGAATTVVALPDLEVTGEAWDGITRVDAGDPRFFSAGGAFVWPSGCNLNSTYDTRSRGALQTTLTTDRGSFTRGAYLERLAAGGGSGCEAWLSPWNMGLEWSPAWPGYRGTGRYHDGHAWAIDQFLDRAEELGVRVNLSLFNHGMARNGGGAEDDWKYHPYFRGNGGWLDTPDGLFSDERAFTCQAALFRYLGARYGDSPALLGWKLWAEVNLAHASHDQVVAWHDRAAKALHARDPYQHPICTHWCGDWQNADRAIAAFPSINYLTIDAYHGEGTPIAELLNQSTRDPLSRKLGLADLAKPILVSEFGGSSGACSRERMRAEFAIGPWAGFVSGHAGAPMLWWFEWIDQEDRFGVYGALEKFTHGEDLRGKNAQCVAPAINAPNAALWCRTWSRPGRILGYVVDRTWSMSGGSGTPITDAVIHIGDEVAAGSMRLEWWDPDLGSIVSQIDLIHAARALDVRPPAFSRHLAFKLWRQ